MRTTTMLLTLALTTTCAIADTHQDDIRAQIAPIVDNGLVPGLVVGILEDSETNVMGFGSISHTGDAAPNGETIYEIGSITKAFTGILLADASLRGAVDLDDELGEHLPDDTDPPAWKQGDRSVQPTLTQIATHTSGLPRMPANFGAISTDNPFAGYDRGKLWSFLDGFSIPVKPGNAYTYSNLGVGLLGTVLADKADTTYEELVRARIAEPLGMNDTAITLSDEQQDRLAPGTKGGIIEVQNWDFDALAGAGAIRSTANDLLTLAHAVLEQPDSDPGGAIALSIKRQHTLAEQTDDGPDTESGAGVGLGWHIASDGTTRWHNGQTNGYHAYLGVDTINNNAVVVLANGPTPTVDIAGEHILRILAGESPDPPDVRESTDVADKKLEPLEGTYISAVGFVVTIAHRKNIDGEGHGALIAQLTNQPALRIWAESPTEFFYREVPATIEFTVDEQHGIATQLALRQGGREFVCKRAMERE